VRSRVDVVVVTRTTLKDPFKRAHYNPDHKNQSNVRSKLAAKVSDSKGVTQGIDIQCASADSISRQHGERSGGSDFRR